MNTAPIEFSADGQSTTWTKGDLNILPKAQTCFNSIHIPPYDNYDVLVAKFDCAVKECKGFGWDV